MNDEDPQKQKGHDSEPVLNIWGFVLGGSLTIILPIVGLLFGMATGLSLVEFAVSAGVISITFLGWKWSTWPQPTKQFVLMVLLGILVGCGFIGVAYYNMRGMNSGWFQ